MSVSWERTPVMRVPPALTLLEVKGLSTAPVIQDTEAMAVLALVCSKRPIKTDFHLRVTVVPILTVYLRV